ncbi:unnamed protein product [Rhizophagus irregularis]|nr:unnamed protein product [Rhizophagus irregularis]CAB5394421.1 unnamed protein product [Rhizophagus irregularis]
MALSSPADEILVSKWCEIGLQSLLNLYYSFSRAIVCITITIVNKRQGERGISFFFLNGIVIIGRGYGYVIIKSEHFDSEE